MPVKKTRVIVLRTAGTNCDQETAFAFSHFGAEVECVHIQRLYDKEVHLKDFHILALPGGFTYGDDIESGRILANELRFYLGADICEFLGAGKLVIGICNGFQVLVKAGILPGLVETTKSKDPHAQQLVSLTNNDSGKFEDRWSYVKVEGNSVWTKDLAKIEFFPVAHAEGKFVTSPEVLKKLEGNHQVAFRYCSFEGNSPGYPDNPNGSMADIAGITDSTGRVLGLMPHPERHFFHTQHPFWTRISKADKYGQGAKIFENGIKYVQENLF